MNKLRHLLIVILFVIGGVKSGFAQLYQADFIATKNNNQFTIIHETAYLSYHLKDKEVILLFNDSIYSYRVKRTGKPKDKKRFTIIFKKSDDQLLWNISEKGNYMFAFLINGTTYWFKKLSHPTLKEFEEQKAKLE